MPGFEPFDIGFGRPIPHVPLPELVACEQYRDSLYSCLAEQLGGRITEAERLVGELQRCCEDHTCACIEDLETFRDDLYSAIADHSLRTGVAPAIAVPSRVVSVPLPGDLPARPQLPPTPSPRAAAAPGSSSGAMSQPPGRPAARQPPGGGSSSAASLLGFQTVEPTGELEPTTPPGPPATVQGGETGESASAGGWVISRLPDGSCYVESALAASFSRDISGETIYATAQDAAAAMAADPSCGPGVPIGAPPPPPPPPPAETIPSTTAEPSIHPPCSTDENPLYLNVPGVAAPVRLPSNFSFSPGHRENWPELWLNTATGRFRLLDQGTTIPNTWAASGTLIFLGWVMCDCGGRDAEGWASECIAVMEASTGRVPGSCSDTTVLCSIWQRANGTYYTQLAGLSPEVPGDTLVVAEVSQNECGAVVIILSDAKKLLEQCPANSELGWLGHSCSAKIREGLYKLIGDAAAIVDSWERPEDWFRTPAVMFLPQENPEYSEAKLAEMSANLFYSPLPAEMV